MKSILLLHPSLTARGGGIEQYGRHLLEALSQLYPEARLNVVLGDERELARPELLHIPGLRVTGAGGARRQRMVEMVARALVAAVGRPEWVVSGHLNYAPLAWGVARATGARLIQLLYGVEAWTPGAALPRWAATHADRVVAISSYTAERASATLGVVDVRVLHNAIDTGRFSPAPASLELERRLPPRPRVLTVARLDGREGYKGVDVVLRALQGSQISYVVVGEGSDRERLTSLARSLGVNACFLGRASDRELPEIYRAVDVFAMPSRGEGFGYVFLEALASGIPVVAGNADGSVDALGGGDLGLLVDPTDAEAVRRAIVAHLENQSPARLRDAKYLRGEVERRFGVAGFAKRAAAAFAQD